MGVVEIIVGISLAVSIATMTFSIVSAPKNKSKNKQDMSSFQVTRAEEGQVIPLPYGKNVRVAGSIVWYGNIRYREMSAGGKGGSSSSSGSGYKTYCDCHIVLCEGKIELNSVWKDEEEYKYQNFASTTFNDGSTNVFHNYAEYAVPLNGISHIFFKDWYLGQNTNAIPSLSFNVTRVLTTPLNCYTSTGENPANIVYDLVTRAGGICDITSFQEVADYFNGLDWGLSLVFDAQEETGKLIERIQEHVDVVIYREGGIYYLRQTHSPLYIMDINERDVKDFTFSRVAYNQIFNDISANYRNTDNTDRTVSLVNEAVVAITGERKNHTYDLKGFKELNVLKARFSELFDRDTYPLSQVNFKTSLKYYDLLPGDLVGVPYSPMGLNKQYLITKAVKDPFRGEIEFSAREYANVTLGEYPVGTPSWEDLNLEPEDLDSVTAIPFRYGKYREFRGRVPILILPERKLGVEFSYDIYFSRDGVAYEYIKTSYNFAFSGTLQEDYSGDTHDIDSEGFEFLYEGEGYSLDAQTFPELFTSRRVLVVNQEVMKFQEAENVPASDNVILRNILRGTKKQTHTSGSKAYITEVGENIIEVPVTETSYFKICPRTARGVLDTADATAISITPAIDVSPPTMLKATRDGSDIFLEIFPNSQSNYGCGYGDANLVTDTPHPQKYEGSLLISVNGGATISQVPTTLMISEVSETTIEVKQTAYGYISDPISIVVGVDDGEYIS